MTFVAFGITGDLMRLKILPALYGLHSKNELPENMRIIGISRKAWSDAELQSYIKEILPGADASFISRFSFLEGDAQDVETFSQLSAQCGDDDVLMYLSLSPTLYATVFANMSHAGFGARAGTTRMMIEKPFGTSGAHAEELYQQLKSVIKEEDIYFVDHYCAKDWVRNLAELSISRKMISSIHVRFFETIGVEKRGALYDKLGALRDVGQNHVLQMVAHILQPKARAEALEQLPLLTPAQIETETLRAQYEGYKDIKGVAKDSNTETYFKVHVSLIEGGWRGVGLTLEGGKALPHSSKEVVLTLKDGSTKTISEFPNSIPEYEMLIAAAIQGDKTLFPSMREIRAQWRFIDPILDVWATGAPSLLECLHL